MTKLVDPLDRLQLRLENLINHAWGNEDQKDLKEELAALADAREKTWKHDDLSD